MKRTTTQQTLSAEVIVKAVAGIDVGKYVDVDGVNARAIELSFAADALVIASDADKQDAADQLKNIRVARAGLVAMKGAATTPFAEFVKRVGAVLTPIAAMLDDAETKIKTRVDEYNREQARLLAAEQARREQEHADRVRREQAAAAKKKTEYVPPPAPAPVVVPTRPTYGPGGGGMTERKTLEFEVVSIADVPVELLDVSVKRADSLLRSRVAAGADPATAVPGLRGYWNVTIVGR